MEFNLGQVPSLDLGSSSAFFSSSFWPIRHHPKIQTQVFLKSNPSLNSDFCKDKNLKTKQVWSSKFLPQTCCSPLKVC
jgi:hypothetical protein